MKLIDTDMLKDAMSKRVAEKRDLNASFYEVINEQPIVDAEPIVRCKNCTHYGTSIAGLECQGYCMITEYMTRKENDYCSYGERKRVTE